jgi:hypothetical protein
MGILSLTSSVGQPCNTAISTIICTEMVDLDQFLFFGMRLENSTYRRRRGGAAIVALKGIAGFRTLTIPEAGVSTVGFDLCTLCGACRGPGHRKV